MDQPTQFRSAFNGFHRDDVVRYLEFINNKHSSQVAQLNNELELLRAKQPEDSGRVSELEQQVSDLTGENAELKARVAELEEALRQAKDSVPVAVPAAQPRNDLELETYRRAERVERVAKERARQISEQTNAALSSAFDRVTAASGQFSEAVEQVVTQLNLLQSAMDSSNQAFKDASEIMEKLNGEIEE